MKEKRPKEFWRLFTKAKTESGKDITVENFYDYFKNTTEEINVVQNEEAENVCNNYDYNSNDPILEEPDAIITESELQTGIKTLKRDQSNGSDNILTIISLKLETLLLHLTALFNLILDKGYFPET